MQQPPRSLTGWVAFLSTAEIPVLAHTAQELARLQADEDRINARSIAHVVTSDPMMTLKLLRFLQEHKHRSQMQELVQVEQAIMMMGLTTFHRDVPAAPTVEELLADHPEALSHLLETVARAQRAAHYAFDWALLLHDLHAEEVRVAALLNHLFEMLMWCFNPRAMLRIHAMQEADRTLRSHAAQQEVLGFKGADLQCALETAWHLPELLQQLSNPALAEHLRVRNVALALNLARHSAHGWDDAALPDDYRDIAALLRTEPEKVRHMLAPTEVP